MSNSSRFKTVVYSLGRKKRGECYRLFFNDHAMSFETVNQISGGAVKSHFTDSYSLPWETGANNINVTLYTPNDSKLNVNVKLPEANISKDKIIVKIESPYLTRPKITNLFTLNKELVLMKGAYFYATDEAKMIGYEHPYFGILSIKEDKVLIEDNHALLRVLMIDGKHYFVTHFQKPESCARGLVIYRLDEGRLLKAFDYSVA